MAQHKAPAERNPLVLLAAFATIAALLVGVGFAMAEDDADLRAKDPVQTSTPAPESPSASPTIRRTPTARIQGGKVIAPVPKPTCRQEPVDVSITVLSYNIKSARIGGGIGTYLGIIRESGADVVLLQEVDMNRRGTRINQPAYLADNLGWEWAFGRNVGYGATSGYGTAILSRYPILSQSNTLLPNGPGGQQRGLLKVVADVDGVNVSFYSTHLQNKIDYLKVRQAGAIAPIVAADPNPKVLGGDMNSHSGSQPLNLLEGPLDDTWGAVGVGSGLTHPSTRPRGRIDFLMHGGPDITAETSDVLGYTNSDHRAVRATYDVNGSTRKVCTRPR